MTNNEETKECRDDFEAWAKSPTGCGRISRSTEPGFTDDYADGYTGMAWLAWQAAWNRRAQVAGWKPIEKMGDPT